MCEDGRPLQEVWMVLEFCNRGTLSDAIQRGWLLAGMSASAAVTTNCYCHTVLSGAAAKYVYRLDKHEVGSG